MKHLASKHREGETEGWMKLKKNVRRGKEEDEEIEKWKVKWGVLQTLPEREVLQRGVCQALELPHLLEA